MPGSAEPCNISNNNHGEVVVYWKRQQEVVFSWDLRSPLFLFSYLVRRPACLNTYHGVVSFLGLVGRCSPASVSTSLFLRGLDIPWIHQYIHSFFVVVLVVRRAGGEEEYS